MKKPRVKVKGLHHTFFFLEINFSKQLFFVTFSDGRFCQEKKVIQSVEEHLEHALRGYICDMLTGSLGDVLDRKRNVLKLMKN